MTTQLKYGMSVRTSLPFDRAVELVTGALKHEGFGVLTTIDVRKTMWDKLGEEFPDHVILGACNPALAYMALRDDVDIGLLLPCNVDVRTDPDDEQTIVSILDPGVMSSLSSGEGVEEVADLAREKLQRVLTEVKGAAQ